MRVTITFTTDNDAFNEDLETEVDRVLDQVKRKLYGVVREPYSFKNVDIVIRDSNGNRIGECRIEREDA